MKRGFFFKRNSKPFYDKLKRLHLVNGFLVFTIILCGFFLITPFFEEAYPSLRYAIKHFHYFIGALILLMILFYLPKIKSHLQIMQTGKFKVILVLVLLLSMIISGFTLGFLAKPFPVLGKIALIVHDTTFFILVPYILYHAATKILFLKKQKVEETNKELKA